MLLIKQILLVGMVLFGNHIVQSITKPKMGSVQLRIKSIASKKGCIRIALYKGEQFFLKDGYSCLGKMIPVKLEGEMEIVLPDLKQGYYALAVYHDTNNNGQLDKNILGIPKEPYGFSNNPRAKWRAPKFKETVFHLDQTQKKLIIDLKPWKNW